MFPVTAGLEIASNEAMPMEINPMHYVHLHTYTIH